MCLVQGSVGVFILHILSHAGRVLAYSGGGVGTCMCAPGDRGETGIGRLTVQEP